MEFRKTDWHYRIYAWSFSARGKAVPTPKDQGDYVWRVAVRAPLMVLCSCFMMFLAMALWAGVSAAVLMLQAFVLVLTGLVSLFLGPASGENKKINSCRKIDA